MRVVLIAGGTGAAKLAGGLAEGLAPGELTVVVNTGDDEVVDGVLVTHDRDEVRRYLHGADVPVLAMSDDPATVRVQGDDGVWRDFGEALRRGGELRGVELARDAQPTAEVLVALDGADRVVIGPSNPAISIGPVLALAGVRERLMRPRVVAVSPYFDGRSLDAQADELVRAAGMEVGDEALRAHYAPFLDALVDEHLLMRTREDRVRLARLALDA